MYLIAVQTLRRRRQCVQKCNYELQSLINTRNLRKQWVGTYRTTVDRPGTLSYWHQCCRASSSCIRNWCRCRVPHRIGLKTPCQPGQHCNKVCDFELWLWSGLWLRPLETSENLASLILELYLNPFKILRYQSLEMFWHHRRTIHGPSGHSFQGLPKFSPKSIQLWEDFVPIPP